MNHLEGWCPRCREHVELVHHGVNANACQKCGLVNIPNSQAMGFDDDEVIELRSEAPPVDPP